MNESTGYPCPACESVELQERQEAGVPYVECPNCYGRFFSVSHLCAYLGERIGDREAEPVFMRLLKESLAEDEPDGGLRRKCIVCSAQLQRFGLGEHPLAITDRCSEHGLWFDQHDLPKVERQVRACLRLDDVPAEARGREPEASKPKTHVAPSDHKVVCPNCRRRYPESFLDQRCEDCNVSMYMD